MTSPEKRGVSRRNFIQLALAGGVALGVGLFAPEAVRKALANGEDKWPEVVRTKENISYIYRNDPNIIKKGPLYFYQIANGMWSLDLSTYKPTIYQFSEPGIRGYIKEAHPNEVPGYLEGDVSGYYGVWQADEGAPKKANIGWFYYYPIDSTI